MPRLTPTLAEPTGTTQHSGCLLLIPYLIPRTDSSQLVVTLTPFSKVIEAKKGSSLGACHYATALEASVILIAQALDVAKLPSPAD